MERVRCMLLSSGVDKRFWGEAVSTASTLINMSPSSAIDFGIPDSIWYGRPPNFAKLKSFGCRSYAHIKQGKLDSKALRCIFLGYQSGSKAFRLWCTEPNGGKLIISRDVSFDEKTCLVLIRLRLVLQWRWSLLSQIRTPLNQEKGRIHKSLRQILTKGIQLGEKNKKGSENCLSDSQIMR